MEKGLSKGNLDPPERNSLVRQLCTIMLSKTENPNSLERDHVALLLIQKYPFLKGSHGAGHVSLAFNVFKVPYYVEGASKDKYPGKIKSSQTFQDFCRPFFPCLCKQLCRLCNPSKFKPLLIQYFYVVTYKTSVYIFYVVA